MRRFLPGFVLLGLLLTAAPVPALVGQPLAYDRSQSLATLDIIERLARHHYARVPVDDRLSERLLSSYLDALDPNRNVFLRSDIDEFQRLSRKLDNQLLEGDVSAGFDIYARYHARLTDRLQKTLDQLPAMLAEMDFSLDEVLVIDRESMDWPANLSEADDLWRRQIKASVLSLRLADKDMPEIEKLIEKRYRSQLTRMSQVNSEDVFQLYMNSFTELFDPHTNYMSPRSAENFNMNMRLSLEGIGAVLQQEDEFTKVARLVPAGPADKQGELRAADRILSVGQDENGDMTDVVGWRLDEVVDLIRGPKGSVVRLEIARGRDANEERKIVSIVRDKVKLEEQAAQSQILELFYDGALHKLGVIDIPAFYADFEAMQRGDPNFRSTTRDVARLISDLQNQRIEGLIIDLRDNGGGSLQEANALTGLFIESGPTVQIRHSNERVERKQKFRSEGYYSGPLVVLINRLSASASEIFAGAIQDYRRGIVVGSQSFGKGTVQSLTSLNHGHLKLTESKFYRISGDSTQHRGVLPDVEFPTLYDPTEVGESALDNALPWDRIAPVRHRQYQDLDSILGTVRERHDARVSHDPDFAYLRGELELAEKLDSRKTISLNEAVRRKERQERQEAALALENKRRLAKGMEPLSSLDELDAEAENEEAEDGAAEATTHDADEREARDDILLTEAGNVLLDAIQLTQRVAARN